MNEGGAVAGQLRDVRTRRSGGVRGMTRGEADRAGGAVVKTTAQRQRFTSRAGYASASAQPTSMHAAKPTSPALCEWNVSRSQPMK